MGKTKHNPPGKKEPEPKFIKFTELQTNYLWELRERHHKELNDALMTVYREHGIAEQVIQAPPGMYNMRPDLSGVDIVPMPEVPEAE